MSLALAGVRAALTPRWVSDDLWKRAGQMPAFDINFTRQTITDRIAGITPTYTRPSSEKRLWNGSAFQTYAADVPGFELRNGIWEYAHEPAATNLYLNSGTPATQSITVSAVQYTLSFYGTGTLTLSGASTAGPLVGTGAAPNRVSLTFTPTAGSLTLTLSGSIINPQLETGPVATSPIVTTGSAVTRNADVMSITGTPAADLIARLGSSYWAYVEGTYMSGANGSFISADDNTNNERWRIAHNGTSSSSVIVVYNNTAVAALGSSAGQWPLGAYRKFVVALSQDNFRTTLTGGSISADTSGGMPTVTQFKIGAAQAIPIVPVLFIRRIALFPGIPSDALLNTMVV